MKCSACNNPYDESTGHVWTANVKLCGPCARDWVTWYKKNDARTNKLVPGARRVPFYKYAKTSIIPKD